MRIRIILLGIAAILSAACTPWPSPSTGGYAAYYMFTPAYQRELACGPNCSPCLLFLSQRLAGLLKKRDDLRNSHAAKCYPARMVILDKLGQQIAQEIAAGLLIAVETDLMIYQQQLNELYKLNRIRTCIRPLKHLESRLK